MAAIAVTFLALASPAKADTTGTIVVSVNNSSGAPDQDPQVDLLFPNGVGYASSSALGGTHTFTGVTPGSYVLRVSDGDGRVTQFYHQKLTLQQADQISVAAGQTTTINETMLAGGVIQAHLTDSTTGAPVNNVCATLNNDSATQVCGLTNGLVQFTDLGQGTDSIQITPTDGLHMPYSINDIAVQLGQTTSLNAKIDPAAAVTGTVVDRATGQPVDLACVSIVNRQLPVFGSDCESDEPTSMYSGTINGTPSGSVQLGQIPAGTYSLFVDPLFLGYGIQWVGANGGTGSQYTALQIHAEPGTVTNIGKILLDRPGSLSGVVHAGDASTPPPANQTSVSTFPLDSATVSADGTYTLSGLGPYAWPVKITDGSGTYASVWAGGSDRKSAELYPVTAGQSAPGPNVVLPQGGQLQGQVQDQNGQPVQGGTDVKLFNAQTGDQIGDSSQTSANYSFTGLATQDIKIEFWVSGHGWTWYRQASSWQDATVVHVTKGDIATLNLSLPPAS
ncbi:hypothetical protein [Actinoallomurus vinaceus]